jgi:hypothetical protein
MKSALFAGVAATLLATAPVSAAVPSVAAPAPGGPAAPSASQDITYAAVKASADKVWDRIDANHDGRIDAADRDARMLQRFAKWDTNHDGVISKDEFLAFVHAREEKWHGHHPGDRDGAPPAGLAHDKQGGWSRIGWGMLPGGRASMAIIGHALHDARKDGVLTRAAFDAAVKARFDTLDTNHDGTLTREELRAAWHDHRAHGGWQHREWRDHGPRPEGPPPPPPSASGR